MFFKKVRRRADKARTDVLSAKTAKSKLNKAAGSPASRKKFSRRKPRTERSSRSKPKSKTSFPFSKSNSKQFLAASHGTGPQAGFGATGFQLAGGESGTFITGVGVRKALSNVPRFQPPKRPDSARSHGSVHFHEKRFSIKDFIQKDGQSRAYFLAK